MAKITCPSCKQRIQLGVRAVTIVCPSCGRRLRINREDDEADAVPALAFPEPSQKPEDELTVFVPSRRPVVAWIIAGIVLSALAVFVWGWLLL